MGIIGGWCKVFSLYSSSVEEILVYKALEPF